MSTVINLQSSDGEIFQVDLEDVMCSETIMELLKKQEGGESDLEVIYLQKINSIDLQMVLEWTGHHKDGPMVFGEWDTAYLERQKPTNWPALIMAADYLKIIGLRDITAAKIKQVIDEKSAQEIREMFEVNLTQEEYDKIIAQYISMFKM